MTEWLISIHPEHVEAILAGRKTIEVRRQAAGWKAGDTAVIYQTAKGKRGPRIAGAFRVAKVERVATETPPDGTCIGEGDWTLYTRLGEPVYLVHIGAVVRAPDSMPAICGGPQSYMRLPQHLVNSLPVHSLLLELGVRP